MPTTKRSKKVKIHKMYGNSVVGHCTDCGEEFEDYLRLKQAYNHAKKTGHKVSVEITSVTHYN